MESKRRIFISLIILVILVIAFYFITFGVTQLTGHAITGQSPKNDFEECLKKQDIKLFIKAANTDLELQKTGLMDYMQYFKIQNCINNNEPCVDNDIFQFPTWIINNKKVTGDITNYELGMYTNCNSL